MSQGSFSLSFFFPCKWMSSCCSTFFKNTVFSPLIAFKVLKLFNSRNYAILFHNNSGYLVVWLLFVFLSPILNFPERILNFAKISQNRIIIWFLSNKKKSISAVQYFRGTEVENLVNQLFPVWHFVKYCSEENTGSGDGRQQFSSELCLAMLPWKSHLISLAFVSPQEGGKSNHL